MATTHGPRIVDVAERILADIRQRKLRRGDAYRGTAETAQWLQVSGSTANRALQLLARRGVVRRRQRQGTTVLDPRSRGNDARLGRVHLMVREDHLRTEGLWSEGVLLGLQSALPGVELQFNFRPEVDEGEHVNRLIHEILGSRKPAGLVLIRSSVLTQRLVAASGLPAVVSGTLQPSIENLASIDRDQRQIGVLLARHLLDAKCRQFLILMRDRLTAGDHDMLDGALSTLAEQGAPLSDVTFRCLPTDHDSVVAEVQRLLRGRAGKTGCLCRSETLARGVDAAANLLTSAPRRKAVIVVADAARGRLESCPYPRIEPTVRPEEWGAALGNMLSSCARGEPPEPFRQVIPVQLHVPPVPRIGRRS